MHAMNIDVEEIERESAYRIRTAVKALMDLHELKHEEFADVLKIGRTAMYSRLSGGTNFKAQEIAAIARFFGVDPGAFYQGREAIVNYMMVGAERQKTEQPEDEISPAIALLRAKKAEGSNVAIFQQAA